MTAEILNLRKIRKAAARKADEHTANANRAKHGEAKAPKITRTLEAEREGVRHAAGKLVPPSKKP